MNYRAKINIDEVKDFIRSQSQETKIYIGGDSERHKIGGKWYADYAVCVVVHKDGKHGCKVFGEITRELDFDSKKEKPTMRLMNEVYKISAMYLAPQDSFGDRRVEVHLDINPKENAGSSHVLTEAIGYIKGTCNVVPMVKPDSPAATFCADRFAELRQRKSESINGKIHNQLSASKLKRRRKSGGAL